MEDFTEVTDMQVFETEQTTPTVVKTEDGKFRRKVSYQKYASKLPETKEEKLEFYKLQSGLIDLEQFQDHIGEEIIFTEVYTNPYTSVNEDTGFEEDGVTTILETATDYYVTSSKSVYHSIRELLNVFPITQHSFKIKIVKKDVPKSKNKVTNIDLIEVLDK